MIRDAQAANEEISPNSFEVQRLQEALPNYFDADGNFQLEKFQTMLKEQEVELSRESYELNFLGKSYARLLASLETETVLVPNGEHNASERNADSENIYITGDNLDALKHLSKSYRGKIKCIYIDPPYNTGSDDFAYNDTFDFTAKDLVEQIGVTDEEAERILDLQGRASHSAWLTFMLPRLVLAKQLMTRDGVIFISIDDNELENLKVLGIEIFGEQNSLPIISVKANPRGRQSNSGLAPVNDYLVGFTASAESGGVFGQHLTQEQIDEFKYEDETGAYRLLGLRQRGAESLREDRPDMFFPLYVDPKAQTVSLTPTDRHTEEVIPRKSDGREGRWMWGETTVSDNLDIIVPRLVKTRGEWDVDVKDYLFRDGVMRTRKSQTIWDDKAFNQQNGTQEVTRMFGAKVSEYPKAVALIERVIEIGTRPGDIVLDFFSGTATTAQAVMQKNASLKMGLKYILVQLDEQIDPKRNSVSKTAHAQGFKTIDEIGRKRIELAADNIAQDTGANIDYGFKHYTLTTPEQAEIDRLESFTADPSLFKIDPLERFTFENAPAKQVMLTTWAVHDGYGLTPDSRQVTLDRYVLDVIGSTAYIIESGFTSKDMIALIRLIESNELQINHVVYFNTALPFEVLTELKQAIRNISTNGSINIEARW